MILTHGANSLPREGGETITIGGRKYPVVTINGTKWLAENLDYKWEGLLIDNDGDVSSPSASYYNHDEATYGVNGNRYGLLYNWEAEKYLRNNISELCPGCRYPSSDDWHGLIDYAGWPNLKSKSGWPQGYDGSDPYGFNMPPGGLYYWQGFGYSGQLALIRVRRYTDWVQHYLIYDAQNGGSPNSTSNWYRCSVRLIVL